MTHNDHNISLAGVWRFSIDRDDIGLSEEWFGNPITGDNIVLPGSMTENDKGDEVSLDTPWTGRIRDTSYFHDDRYEKYRQPGNIKFPCWLTPLKFYKGVAWYQRDVEIPVEWLDRVVHMLLERPHWVTTLWVDGRLIGSGDSHGTPHTFTLGTLTPGKHTLTVRIDNRMVIDVGEDAHSMTDQSQTSWNGIVGDLSLSATSRTWIDNVQVYPAADHRSIEVVTTVLGQVVHGDACTLHYEVYDKWNSDVVTNDISQSAIEGNIVNQTVTITGAVQKWDEFKPQLYTLKVTLLAGEVTTQEFTTDFGFRDFAAQENLLTLNGKRVFLRGTHEGAVFPLTGYPPTDKAEWDRIFKICKNHGLNHMRFHSWCPPRAAFQAADEAGIILSAEASSWAIVGENEEYDEWLYRESEAMLREYGNHPSFCMMLYGNEPYGDNAAAFLGKWVDHFKARDRRRLFSSGTAWPLIPESQFHVWADPRIMLWDQNLDSRINARPPETLTDYSGFIEQYPVPVISHEIGQWCAYPNFDEIPKYTGFLRAYNFEIFRDFLAENGIADQARDFVQASGNLQVLCYKEEIESALRTPDMGGFQLLDLHDYPGQGTALVGVLDAFWDEKGYISPEKFRRFCSPMVPLAKMAKRVFTSDEVFDADILLAHFGQTALVDGAVRWTISGGSTRYEGTISTPLLEAGSLYGIGSISQSLEAEHAARKLILEVSIPGTDAVNDWDIWVYPKKIDVAQPPTGVYITGKLDADALEILENGGRVVFMPDREQVLGDAKGQVPAGFSSIFWNTAWTQGQEPHTLGILCDPAHVALSDFPTEYHSNWQWWYIINRSRSMIMNPLPVDLRPIVQVIDDWFTARKLGLLFECKFGGGDLLVSSVDCKSGLDDDPVCRQWLHSILSYAGSERFSPIHTVTEAQLGAVLRLC